MCGISLEDFLENKTWVAKAYNENYNFSKAPRIPNVKAVVGDSRVTLYWDDAAEDTTDESNKDPVTGFDFEGYIEGLLEYPHYTRPRIFNGEEVPPVLLSGDHEKIRIWRRAESLKRTLARRPDLLDGTNLKEEDKVILDELQKK